MEQKTEFATTEKIFFNEKIIVNNLQYAMFDDPDFMASIMKYLKKLNAKTNALNSIYQCLVKKNADKGCTYGGRLFDGFHINDSRYGIKIDASDLPEINFKLIAKNENFKLLKEELSKFFHIILNNEVDIKKIIEKAFNQELQNEKAFGKKGVTAWDSFWISVQLNENKENTRRDRLRQFFLNAICFQIQLLLMDPIYVASTKYNSDWNTLNADFLKEAEEIKKRHVEEYVALLKRQENELKEMEQRQSQTREKFKNERDKYVSSNPKGNHLENSHVRKSGKFLLTLSPIVNSMSNSSGENSHSPSRSFGFK